MRWEMREELVGKKVDSLSTSLLLLSVGFLLSFCLAESDIDSLLNSVNSLCQQGSLFVLIVNRHADKVKLLS